MKQLKYIGDDVILGVFTKVDKKQNFESNSTFNTDLVILLVENIWEEFPKIIYHKNIDCEGIIFTTTVCKPPIELLVKMINLN
ncbi:hypothetical protein ACNQF7_05920 [Flavobacterium sp. RSP29]|uniref:hypothetical protein n=1 Tax=Flavobacterium sp. RSP29 TaxID=3401731 RepID=UPI003AAE009A